MQGMSTKRKPWLLLTAALGFLVFFVFSQQVMADMFSWFKKKELQLSPVIQGKILLNGRPASGMTVLRDLKHGDDSYSEKQVTDSNGHFTFPAKIIKVRESMFDTAVKHNIYVQQDEIINIFSISNLNTLDFNSFNALLKEMTCELSNPDFGLDLEPDPLNPGIYLGAISKCSFADESVIKNKEIMK
ncbi:DUF6795 domain-containing protein [Rheinheimera pleomorphica]|uniref:DUF6795 domain-containing protein n=1 Tax=Rheinheimera pleomorphica TaxID=2703963 RepID=UPI001423EBE7|nr:DUF6795 domain-containing protein [Rheinheimera pleomorphica]